MIGDEICCFILTIRSISILHVKVFSCNVRQGLVYLVAQLFCKVEVVSRSVKEVTKLLQKIVYALYAAKSGAKWTMVHYLD